MVKIVTITAGHSDTDPGAVNGKRREADIAAELRNIVVFYLKEAGISVRTDGSGFGNLPLKTAVQLIKGAHIAVELHCNAALSKQAGGAEALAGAKYKTLAAQLCTATTKVMENKARGENGGWKPENAGQHSRLAYVSNGGIIFEPFFISNDKELAIYDAKKWLIGKAIAKVLIDYVNQL